MKEIADLIKRLNKKAEKLLKNYALLVEKNNHLSKEINEIKHQLDQKNQQLKAMEDKISLLKIAGNVENKSTKDVKLKINEMVREIDKCIAQISR